MDEVEKAWKAACRVLLGEEIGSLRDYETYLSRHLEKTRNERSAISGKGVTVFEQNFCRGAMFISNDEREEYGRMLAGAKLNVNEVKDMDSIVEAIGERLWYAGNIITGNSQGVEESDACSNSFFVRRSSEIYDSKYVAYSDAMRFGEYVFGSNWIGETRFAIKTYETFKVVRCMEAVRISQSSDCYYVAGVEGCSNCMFSFNQRNRRNLIGNLELERGEYGKLRDKLVGDIRDTLRAKKSVPTIIDLISGGHGQGN
jgi:hypothetical protein